MKLKWKYDKRHKQWWCNHTDNLSFAIDRLTGGEGCSLNVTDYTTTIHQFRTTSSAKEVARLIAFG